MSRLLLAEYLLRKPMQIQLKEKQRGKEEGASQQQKNTKSCQKQNASKDSKNKQIIIIWISVRITTKEVIKGI